MLTLARSNSLPGCVDPHRGTRKSRGILCRRRSRCARLTSRVVGSTACRKTVSHHLRLLFRFPFQESSDVGFAHILDSQGLYLLAHDSRPAQASFVKRGACPPRASILIFSLPIFRSTLTAHLNLLEPQWLCNPCPPRFQPMTRPNSPSPDDPLGPPPAPDPDHPIEVLRKQDTLSTLR